MVASKLCGSIFKTTLFAESEFLLPNIGYFSISLTYVEEINILIGALGKVPLVDMYDMVIG